MKENMKKFFDKSKKIINKVETKLQKLKDKLGKISFLKKVGDVLHPYRQVISLVCFSLTLLALILISILAMHEYVVPVCILMIIEVLMAVFLHRTELWIHGLLLIAQFAAGLIMDRFPLVLLCIIAYVAATVTLQFAYTEPKQEAKKSEAGKSEEPKSEEPISEEPKTEDVAEETTVENLNDSEIMHEKHETEKANVHEKSKHKHKNKKKK